MVSVTPTNSTAYGIIESTDASEIRLAGEYDVEQVVRSYFQDIPVMIEVARCESTFRHKLSDGTILRGVVDPADTGVMQINKRYHEETAVSLGLDLENLQENLAYARHLYERQGTQPWSASQPCWDRTLAMNI